MPRTCSMMGRIRFTLFRMLAMATMALAGATMAQAAEPAPPITITYLTQERERPPALSNLDEAPENEGLAGAELGLADNATTGRFMGQNFTLNPVVVPEDGKLDEVFAELRAKGERLIVLDLPGADVARLAHRPDAADALLFNARSTDDDLRGAACAANLLHTMPSRAMLADALAQYLVTKRWVQWFLVVGPRPEDALYAQAIQRAAKRFGARIVEERRWTEEHDARRTAQAEVPVFTQGVSHDVLIVADEIGDFGDYLMYRTWMPRPVAGTQGLVPTNWHRTHEQWGAAQLQSRFTKKYRRWMTPRDHAVWAALRAVGEAATRTRSSDPATLISFIKGPEMSFGGFKGAPLSFRPWDGQMRQPVLLAADRSMVAVAPMDGFLHPVSPLDTLGWDAPETKCRANEK